ncbi:hypothetical protein AMD27_11620 [Acinetobacter sp. TGL-Y2]|nr:hypothetical protein AMD27_11620 [Acinetobacter sp. TGL-Y2]
MRHGIKTLGGLRDYSVVKLLFSKEGFRKITIRISTRLSVQSRGNIHPNHDLFLKSIYWQLDFKKIIYIGNESSLYLWERVRVKYKNKKPLKRGA